MIGYVFAGGRSSRMGRDKSSLTLGGRSLLDIAVSRLAPLCEDVRICDNACIADVQPGEGPLSALAAALADAAASGDDEIALVSSVDIPFVPQALLKEVAERARKATSLAVIPVAGGQQQPLCAAYRASLAGPVRKAFDLGERRVLAAVRLCCAKAGPGALDEFTPQSLPPQQAEAAFMNLNTPEEFAEAERRWTAK